MEKRKLSFWQIWNMSFGFLGIQMGFALQNSNVSRIFQTLGANIDDIPFMGSRSYDWLNYPTYNWLFFRQDLDKMGRRKPYFLAGAILASAALFIMLRFVVCGWNALDHGRLHQCFDGTISCFCWR
jgi:maltose/moltooligosaccharide transporter